MEYSIKNLEKSCAEITVTIDKDEWDKSITEAYNKNKHQFKIEGFRPGKVPFNVLVKRYGKEIFFEDAIEIALSENYGKILDENKDLEPVSRPELDVKEVNEDGLKATLTVAVYPKFELGQYKGLKIEKIAPKEVTDAEVDEAVSTKRESGARWVDADRAIENGDKVTLDYSGSVDGVKFDGGTAEGQTLDIGSNQFIPGFEEQMVGMKKGESKDLKVTFPKEYHAENLAGKDAIFAVTVHEIQYKVLPELDDEFAKDVSEFDTLAELKADIRKKREEDEALRARYAEDDKMVETVVSSTEIEIPEAMVEEELDRMVQDLQMRMQYSGIKLDDYLKYTNSTMESLRAERKEDAVKSVKTRLILEAIITAEKITVEKEEMDAEIEKLAADANKTVEEMKKGMKEYETGRILNKILAEKLFAFLRDNNDVA